MPSGEIWEGIRRCFTKEWLRSSVPSTHRAVIDVMSATEMAALLPGSPVSAKDWSALIMVTCFSSYLRALLTSSWDCHIETGPNDGTLNGFCPGCWIYASTPLLSNRSIGDSLDFIVWFWQVLGLYLLGAMNWIWSTWCQIKFYRFSNKEVKKPGSSKLSLEHKCNGID